MKTTIYVAGVERPGSGSWDWFPSKENCENYFNNLKKTFSDLPDATVYLGEIELEISENTNNKGITAMVEEWLMDHGYNDAFPNTQVLNTTE